MFRSRDGEKKYFFYKSFKLNLKKVFVGGIGGGGIFKEIEFIRVKRG